MTTRRAAIYCRVSSNSQDTTDPWASLPRQEEVLRALAQRDGATVAVAYQEVYTGTTQKRPDFIDLLDRCKRGEVQAIYVASFDRLTRAGSMGELEQLRHELVRLGVDLISPSQTWRFSDPTQDTPETTLTFNMMGAVVGYDRGKIAQRMQLGRERKAKAGGDYGAPCPFGYRPVFDLHTGAKAFEVVPEEAAVVREIYRAYLAGDGYQKITKWVNQQGLPPPYGGRWTAIHIKKIMAGDDTPPELAERVRLAVAEGDEPKAIAQALNAEGVPRPGGHRWGFLAVKYILANAQYAGLSEWLKGPYRRRIKSKGQTTIQPSLVYPAIIDIDMMQRAREAGIRRAGAPKRDMPGLYPLSGLLRCEVCGASCISSGMVLRRSGGRYTYYACRAKRDQRLECERPAMYRMDEAHRVVLAFLQHALPSRAPGRAKRKSVVSLAAVREREDVRRELAGREQEETNLVRHLGQGVLSAEAYRRASQQIEEEVQRLRQRLVMIELGGQQEQTEAERLADRVTIARVVKHFRADDPQLRGLFAKVIQEVKLVQAGRDPKDKRKVILAVSYLKLRTGEVLPLS